MRQQAKGGGTRSHVFHEPARESAAICVFPICSDLACGAFFPGTTGEAGALLPAQGAKGWREDTAQGGQGVKTGRCSKGSVGQLEM